MDAALVAGMVVRAIEDNRLYVFTHGEYAEPMTRRHRALEAAIAEVPVSDKFDPSQPLAGTPEFTEAMIAAGR
jgi:hypothetical protein